MTRIFTRILELETLNAMRIMDNTVEEGDCLLWTGSTNATGYPHYKPTGKPCTLVRRDALKLSGTDLAPRQPVGTTCNEKRCVNPAHLFPSTTAEIGRAAAKRGGWTGVARAAKIAATKRKSSICKMDMDKARTVRLSTEPIDVLAAEYDVNRAVIVGIRNGSRWKDYSSPFAGLMAANGPMSRRKA